MQTFERVINAVKGAYVEAAEWVSAHPHMTIWGALAAIAWASVF